VAAEAAANPDWNEPKRIEPNRAREVELREEQLGAPNSSTNPDLGSTTKRRRIEEVVVAAGGFVAGQRRIFPNRGIPCPRLFFSRSKIGLRVFARNYTHTNKYKYREIREQKEEGKMAEEGISVHEKEWRGEKERRE
jgi:hypothetical protein